MPSVFSAIVGVGSPSSPFSWAWAGRTTVRRSARTKRAQDRSIRVMGALGQSRRDGRDREPVRCVGPDSRTAFLDAHFLYGRHSTGGMELGAQVGSGRTAFVCLLPLLLAAVLFLGLSRCGVSDGGFFRPFLAGQKVDIPTGPTDRMASQKGGLIAFPNRVLEENTLCQVRRRLWPMRLATSTTGRASPQDTTQAARSGKGPQGRPPTRD